MLDCKKHLFDLDDHVTFLNTSYMSPLPSHIAEIGHKALDRKRKPYLFTDQDFFTEPEHLKITFSKLIGNPQPDRIAFIPAASYGIETAARNIPLHAGDEIILLQEQFPSNYYPWMKIAAEKNVTIRTIASPESIEEKGIIWNQNILNSISKKTKVVSIAPIHWSEGILYDLKRIRERCDEVGAYLVLDGTQSIGALPFSIKEIMPDALICASYKWLMGPYSFGMAYYGEKFDEGNPLENNWINRLGSEDFTRLVDYEDRYKSGASRYSCGEHSNFVAIPILEESLKLIMEWGPQNIQAYCASITAPLEILKNKGYKIVPANQRAQHLFGIKLPDHVEINKLKQTLKAENIIISIRGRYVRVSPYVFNTINDIQKLTDVLNRF